MRIARAIVAAIGLATTLAACRGYERHWFPGPKAEHPSVAPKGLPDSAFRVDWQGVELPSQVAPGQIVDVRVRLRNASPMAWPAGAHSDPQGRVRLSWRWWPPLGDPTTYADRVDFPGTVGPGESVAVVARVTAPAIRADYRLQFDLVSEFVCWFEPRGVAPNYVAVSVR